ncbi:MAG TPA: HD domain-containing protein [Pyrinomonadaceae bacterium]|jgi:(p)ppGpp synthase/HD superfamily hydrolase
MTDATPPRFRSDSPRFLAALNYAATLHAGQVRKATSIPYVSHLLSVAGIAIEHGADEDEAIAALLHDAPEDCGGLPVLEEIRARFGERVAEIVAACSDTFETPKPPWSERKARYIAHVRAASPSVRLISMSDKLHNARAILADYRQVGEAVFARFKRGEGHSVLWYYRRLADEFNAAGSASPLAQELDRVVSELESLSLADKDDARAERRRVYEELNEALAAALH